MQRVIIFANGEIPNLEQAHRILLPADHIICADGGTRHALALNLIPNLVVGDMDSITMDQWQALERAGVSIELIPRDKDEIDLELALKRAIELEPKEILIVGALGGRSDQALANIALLSDPSMMSHDARIDDGVEELFFCREKAQVHGRSGDIVSLIPWGNPVDGVQTENLKWPLKAETLYPEKTRGVSNEMIGDTAAISIKSGLLLIIHRRQQYTLQ